MYIYSLILYQKFREIAQKGASNALRANWSYFFKACILTYQIIFDFFGCCFQSVIIVDGYIQTSGK